MDKRKLYTLCGCIFPLMIGYGVVYSMFSLYLYDVLKVAKSQIGLIYMCGSLTGFIFAPLIGGLADRFGRKIVILGSIGSFALVFMAYSAIQNYRFVYGIQAIEGVSWVAIGAAVNAYIADIIPHDKRGWAMGIYQRTMSLGWVMGPVMGGFLFEAIGFRTAFLIGAIVVGLSIIPSVIFVRETKQDRQKS